MHSKSRFTNGSTAGKFSRISGISLVERYDTVTVVNIADSVIDRFHIISLVSNEGAFFNGKILIGFLLGGFGSSLIIPNLADCFLYFE